MNTQTYYAKKQRILNTNKPEAKKHNAKFNLWIEYINEQVVKSKLGLIAILLTCTTAFADPPPHANNDNENGQGNHNGWGDDDDEDGTPIDDYIGVLAISAIALGGFIKLKN